MKIIYPLFFLILLSCNTTKKEYVCGDHPCIDKKEFNEYFSKNLTIEIKSQDNKKNKSVDLIKLNIDSSSVEKKDNKNSTKEEKIRKKNEKEKLKAEKIRLLEERKIRKKEEKNKAELAQIAKLKEKNQKPTKNEIINNGEQVNKIVDKIYEDKKPLEQVTEKTVSIDSVKTENVKSICDEIKDCDIDKIAELLIKKGREKNFPDITLN